MPRPRSRWRLATCRFGRCPSGGAGRPELLQRLGGSGHSSQVIRPIFPGWMWYRKSTKPIAIIESIKNTGTARLGTPTEGKSAELSPPAAPHHLTSPALSSNHHGMTPMMKQYTAIRKEPAGGRAPVLPPRRLLRAVLRGRQDRRTDPQRRPDQAQRHADVRRAPPRGRGLHRQAGQSRANGSPSPSRPANRSPGKIVEREVTQIISAGTVSDLNLLDAEQPNYLAAVYYAEEALRARLRSTTPPASSGSPSSTAASALEDELAARRARPRSSTAMSSRDRFSGRRQQRLRPTTATPSSTSRRHSRLKEHFKVQSLDGFGCADMPAAIGAAGAIFHYLEIPAAPQRRSHPPPAGLPAASSSSSSTPPASATSTSSNSRAGHETHPARTPSTAPRRRWAPASCATGSSTRCATSIELDRPPGPHRRPARASPSSSARSRDRSETCATSSAPSAASARAPATPATSSRCADIAAAASRSSAATSARSHGRDPARRRALRHACAISPSWSTCSTPPSPTSRPPRIKDGGIFRDGYSAAPRRTARRLQRGEAVDRRPPGPRGRAHRHQSLKVKYNNVFGYFIEITKSNLDNVPDDYTRKQTMANAERFITPELKEIENKILGADERAKTLEYEEFLNLRETVLEHLDEHPGHRRRPRRPSTSSAASPRPPGSSATAARSSTSRCNLYHQGRAPSGARPEHRRGKIRPQRHPPRARAKTASSSSPARTWPANRPTSARSP